MSIPPYPSYSSLPRSYSFDTSAATFGSAGSPPRSPTYTSVALPGSGSAPPLLPPLDYFGSTPAALDLPSDRSPDFYQSQSTQPPSLPSSHAHTPDGVTKVCIDPSTINRHTREVLGDFTDALQQRLRQLQHQQQKKEKESSEQDKENTELTNRIVGLQQQIQGGEAKSHQIKAEMAELQREISGVLADIKSFSPLTAISTPTPQGPCERRSDGLVGQKRTHETACGLDLGDNKHQKRAQASITSASSSQAASSASSSLSPETETVADMKSSYGLRSDKRSLTKERDKRIAQLFLSCVEYKQMFHLRQPATIQSYDPQRNQFTILDQDNQKLSTDNAHLVFRPKKGQLVLLKGSKTAYYFPFIVDKAEPSNGNYSLNRMITVKGHWQGASATARCSRDILKLNSMLPITGLNDPILEEIAIHESDIQNDGYLHPNAYLLK